MGQEPSAGSQTMLDSSAGEDDHVPEPVVQEQASRVGRYAILEKIGSGGMGEVYAAYDERLDRKIALKLLHHDRRTKRSRKRLAREAQALARLSHPNVVTVFEAGIHEERVFIAMEFVRGQTLRDWIGGDPRSWADILEVFVGAAEGLAAMHEQGLIHRDFKPDNVIVDSRHRPRLIDFGLVRLQGGDEDDNETEEEGEIEPYPIDPLVPESLTRTGAILGTPMYMSPEQFDRQPATAASDQFSLCVALYEALYGESPFPDENHASRALAVLAGNMRQPPHRPDVPSELLAVLTRGMRREPQERWPDMVSLCAALHGILASFDPEIEDPAAVRSRRRFMLGTLGVVLMVVVGFGVLDPSGNAPPPMERVLTMEGTIVTVVCLSLWLLRKRWSGSRHGRRIAGLLLLLTSTFFLQNIVGALTGRSLYHSVLANGVIATTLLIAAAPLTAQILRWSGLWMGLWTVMMIVDPSRFFLYFNVGVLGGALGAALMLPRRVVQRWIKVAATEGSHSREGSLLGSRSRPRSLLRTRSRPRSLLSSRSRDIRTPPPTRPDR